MTPRKASVYLLWGEDEFLLREAALDIVGPEVHPREVDASEWRGGELGDLVTPSLFGEPRALVVADCRALPEEGMRELRGYLESPDADAVLVLCARIPERGKVPATLAKLIEPVGSVQEVRVTRKDLAGWLLQRAKRHGADLAPEGATALVGTLGEEPAALDQALTQLASAFAGERLTRDRVSQQFRGLGEQHIWDLCDKAFGKDVSGAMRSLRTLLEARDDPLKILGGIAARLRDLLRVRSLPDRMPLSELTRAAGLRFEWQARRYREQARRFSLEELVELHRSVTEADRALKSGASDEMVLPVLVERIAGEPARVS